MHIRSLQAWLLVPALSKPIACAKFCKGNSPVEDKASCLTAAASRIMFSTKIGLGCPRGAAFLRPPPPPSVTGAGDFNPRGAPFLRPPPPPSVTGAGDFNPETDPASTTSATWTTSTTSLLLVVCVRSFEAEDGRVIMAERIKRQLDMGGGKNMLCRKDNSQR